MYQTTPLSTNDYSLRGSRGSTRGTRLLRGSIYYTTRTALPTRLPIPSDYHLHVHSSCHRWRFRGIRPTPVLAIFHPLQAQSSQHSSLPRSCPTRPRPHQLRKTPPPLPLRKTRLTPYCLRTPSGHTPICHLSGRLSPPRLLGPSCPRGRLPSCGCCTILASC
ncbi:hypothetical protein BGX38DRAFT_1184924 [Terfezia claveryi]|nr:hypothetical protein BGX38DRAFT_1184924 [Terfezia claveryi]